MRVLGSIIPSQPLLMRAGRSKTPECAGVGAQLVGDQQFGHEALLLEQLAHQPQDVKVATAPTVGTRFIVDIVAAETASGHISAAVVVAQTFPMEEFRPRIKEGEDANALLNNIRYFTLLRLHELMPEQTASALCERVAADLEQKVLSAEYTERDD